MDGPCISDEKQRQLAQRMAGLGVREADLEERFVLGSGPGGQKINKTSSCVRLRHVPSGIEVKCGRSRAQSMNRYLARREVCDRLEERRAGILSARRKEAERVRRQKRRRSRRQKQRILEAKRKRGDLKRERGAVSWQDG